MCSLFFGLCLSSFLPPMSVSTEQFQVVGPQCPIVAVLGEDAILPSLVPAMNAENVELRWFRITFSQAAFIYWNQHEQSNKQMAEYTGRTSIVRDFLTQGQDAVHIRKVQVSDNGTYTCFFRKGGFYEEADLELKVAGMDSDPQVHTDGPEKDGVHVVCTASGWFPEPQVQWTDLSGKKFPLFSVEATLVVTDSSVGNVTCSVLNPILGQEKAMAIFIPDPFFPQNSPWKPAFAVILTMLGLLLFGASCFIKKEHSTRMQVRQEKENLRQVKEEEWQTKEETLKAIGPVTLDRSSTHYRLAVSHEKMHLTWNYARVYLNDNCSVLGLEGIVSGRCYWEVEIENEFYSMWALGVCRKEVKRTGWYMELPDRWFWVKGKFDHRYFAWTDSVTWLSLRQDPCRVGVFLDYSEGVVSFYNMIDGSYIFSFPPASFSGILFPYCMFMSGDVSMTICSMASGSEGLSVPPNISPPLEETLSTQGRGSAQAVVLMVLPQRLNLHYFPDTPRFCPHSISCCL
uniref:Butyrophilin subfamily 1 member A1 n=1 Tax=Sciurus vulgaris TaxID=55149 RepID=A0A8D2B3J3_SCIVU